MSGYVRFTHTGVPQIDAIAFALERAGNLFHHTSQWTDGYPNDADPSPLEAIQKALNDAAAALDEAQRGAPLQDCICAPLGYAGHRPNCDRYGGAPTGAESGEATESASRHVIQLTREQIHEQIAEAAIWLDREGYLDMIENLTAVGKIRSLAFLLAPDPAQRGSTPVGASQGSGEARRDVASLRALKDAFDILAEPGTPPKSVWYDWKHKHEWAISRAVVALASEPPPTASPPEAPDGCPRCGNPSYRPAIYIGPDPGAPAGWVHYVTDGGHWYRCDARVTGQED